MGRVDIPPAALAIFRHGTSNEGRESINERTEQRCSRQSSRRRNVLFLGHDQPTQLSRLVEMTTQAFFAHRLHHPSGLT